MSGGAGARRRGERGATLMETAMAVGLLAIAALGIGHVTVGIQRANKASHNATLAAALAADKLEELRALDAAGLAGGEDAVAMPDHPAWTFTRVWSVTDNDDDAGVPLGTRRIDVTVTWSERAGRQVTMATLQREDPSK